MMTKRWTVGWKVVGIAALLGIAFGGWFLFSKSKLERDQRFTSSCANHAIQHKFSVTFWLSEKGSHQFSAETNARLAMAPITEQAKTPEGNWLDSYGSACPESFNRDRSIGYVFLADSLKVDGEASNAAIVLICPAENHQGSSEHGHAVMTSGLLCLTNNLAALRLLQEHLGNARNGVIRYSANAQAVMRREISIRKKFEADRH